MLSIRIGKKMYDVCKCPYCGENRIGLSRYSDRIICAVCRHWVYVDESKGTPWLKESEDKNE